MFDQILKALGGGNLGDIEAKAGDLLTRLEKLGGDVIGSNGNLLAAIVAIAEDFATLKAVVVDIKQIVSDLETLHANMSATPVPTAAPAAAPTATGAPVSVLGILQAAETVAAKIAPAIAAVAHADPFQAKPLVRAAQVAEPHGGA